MLSAMPAAAFWLRAPARVAWDAACAAGFFGAAAGAGRVFLPAGLAAGAAFAAFTVLAAPLVAGFAGGLTIGNAASFALPAALLRGLAAAGSVFLPSAGCKACTSVLTSLPAALVSRDPPLLAAVTAFFEEAMLATALLAACALVAAFFLVGFVTATFMVSSSQEPVRYLAADRA
ncbi:MAG: hypothetical protein WBG17_13530 [Burkholderiaceae bacterium]